MQKYHIAFFVPGMPFDGSTLTHSSLGGSETAALCMARELAALKHSVKVFSNCPDISSHDGVLYLPASQWGQYAPTQPFDIAIVERAPEAFLAKLNSRMNVLWCHDLALGRQAPQFGGVMWNIDKVMVLSDFMAEQYKAVYRLPDKALWRTRNGIDLDAFKDQATGKRDPKRLVYAARPERGLDVLLEDIMPALWNRDPEIKLSIFGYDNPVAHLAEFYGVLQRLAASYGDRVTWHAPMKQADLYAEYSKCGIYAYPTPSPAAKGFAEISCISLMEAMASGMPIVTSNRGALPETLANGAGVLVDGDPWTDEYRGAFVEAVLGLIRNTDGYAQASAVGVKAAANLDWSAVAKEWSLGFDEFFAEVNDDPVRLARHFYKRSDIEAARAALDGVEGDRADDLRAEIGDEYAFTTSSAAFAEHYAAGGAATSERLETADVASMFERTNEQRFKLFEKILADDERLERILDFGCGHGWCDVYLHNRIGRVWVGVDVDSGAIDWSCKFADEHAKYPDAFYFYQGDHTVDLSGEAPFDALICSEVLEHVLDPCETIKVIESKVKIGGKVIITVPYGPVEYDTPNWHDFRNHIREFDIHDLTDIFGKKPEMTINACFEKHHPILGDACGFFLIQYEADHEPLGEIDMARKLRLQRPRQTVSLCMIAGAGAEETLRWALSPLVHVVDEMVIADTGMNEAGRAIAEEFGARVVPGSDVQTHGFETPRNEALAACREDWAMWIDTDERLCDPQNLHKYLRENGFNGYSIRQHHFAVDAGFNPDMPVRLFRRRPCDGKTMRFWGCIHEHPELALNEGPGPVIVISDSHIAHVGYLVESGRQTRFGRNYPLLEMDRKKYPDRLLQKHFVMRDSVIRAEQIIRATGGLRTAEADALCREALEMYREHFLGKGHYANVDGLHYYSRALEILGEGFEASPNLGASPDGRVSLGFGVARDGVGAINGGPRYRFANAEDFATEMAHRARSAAAPFDEEHW